MPDISMCDGKNCPVRDKCYRFTATPTPMRQAYMTFPRKDDGSCDEFWDNSKMRREMPASSSPHPDCDHGVTFDQDAAEDGELDAYEIRKRWPRLDGPCPKGCGYVGIAYASQEHYVYGDW